MLFYTHIAFAILISLLTVKYLYLSNKPLFLSLAILFSLLPDIDETKSIIGKKTKPISTLTKSIFSHRGLFHSLLFIIPIYLTLSIFSELIALAFLIGTSSHIILDAFTIQGITPLYPLKTRITGIVKTNSITEKILLILIILGIILIIK
jgi:inner membrane protein